VSAAGEGTSRLAEEAARLVDALQGGSDGHTGPRCRSCPVCQGVAVLREVRPETVRQLSAVAVELVGAVRDVLGDGAARVHRQQAGYDGHDGPARDDEVVRPPAEPVRHIEISD
jgi:hypothetical protein